MDNCRLQLTLRVKINHAAGYRSRYVTLPFRSSYDPTSKSNPIPYVHNSFSWHNEQLSSHSNMSSYPTIRLYNCHQACMCSRGSIKCQPHLSDSHVRRWERDLNFFPYKSPRRTYHANWNAIRRAPIGGH
jgi:hypothetical protein